MKTKAQLLHEYCNGCGAGGNGQQEIGAGGGGYVFFLPDGRVAVARAEDGQASPPKLYTQADLDAAIAKEQNPLAKATALMQSFTDEQRMSVMSNFCRHCGSLNPSCYCWNDD